METIFVYITASGRAEAEKLALALLEARLLACANIMDNVSSLYWWEGRIASATEAVLIGKSVPAHREAIISTVTALHSYALPGITFLTVTGGNPEFLAWVEAECGNRG